MFQTKLTDLRAMKTCCKTVIELVTNLFLGIAFVDDLGIARKNVIDVQIDKTVFKAISNTY
jgi:hypothetical protein